MAAWNLSQAARREIGQHFVFGFHGHEVSKDIETLIRDYYLGNVILMKRNVENAHQIHTLVQKLQQLAKDCGHTHPLMVGTDQENGLVSAFSLPGSDASGTQFPGAMALAATGSTELTREVYCASGKELKLVGINWAYSPVADVNSDSRNPVIGVRAFGDEPSTVGQFVNAASHGLTDAGVAPSLKHFPGHGDTHIDSHLALPVIKKGLDDLRRTELIPFLMSSDAATIMTGHMALPLITGSDLPASLSRAATHGLAREQLKYDGLIVTDCLEMAAVAGRERGVPRGAVDALKAGADIVMICHTFAWQVGAIEATYAAVASGELSLEHTIRSGERVINLKNHFAGNWDSVLAKPFPDEEWLVLKKTNSVLAQRAYAASTALVQDPAGLLPISKAGRVLVMTPIPESLNLAVDDADGVLRTADGKLRNTAGSSYLAFCAAVRARCTNVEHFVYTPSKEPDEDTVRDANTILFVTRNADHATWQLDALRFITRMRSGIQNNVVVIESCTPYDLLGLEKGDELRGATVLATFEFTAQALVSAAAVVFDGQEAMGGVPVCKGNVMK